MFVGLSGGVDSSVAAALLKKAGHEVTGVFIRIAIPGYPCSAGEDKISAQRVAAHLKIPFREVDLSAEYKQKVFDLSLREFEQGRTPNPDVLCNREIKFGLFFDWCMQHGAEKVATGHYAQLRENNLYAGADKDKDQSYFLALVPQAKLQHTLFPIGHLEKSEVRKLAKKFGLPNAERKDSQGLCFLGPVSIDEMLYKEIALTRGDALDPQGRVVGSHEGVQAYTLGQRHGFVLVAQSPETRPHYVVAKDVEHNTITVAPNKFPECATNTRVTLRESNWIGKVGDGLYTARYRYRQQRIAAEKRGNEIMLHEPHYAPLGQILVLYQGSQCVGGGIIDQVTIT